MNRLKPPEGLEAVIYFYKPAKTCKLVAVLYLPRVPSTFRMRILKEILTTCDQFLLHDSFYMKKHTESWHLSPF